MVVELRRKIIGFGFAFLANQSSFFIVMVHMMGEWTHVVKKLGIHGPALVFIPESVSNEFTFQFINGIFQQDLMGGLAIIVYDWTQSFILSCQWTIFCRCRGRKPALINAAPFSSQNIVIIRM